LDIVPRGTELGTQVKTGSPAGRTHTLNNPQVEYSDTSANEDNSFRNHIR